jgi:ketopantoate reductase
MLDESVAVAMACGYKAIGEFPFTKRRRDDKAGFSLTSSMYRDLQKGRCA